MPALFKSTTTITTVGKPCHTPPHASLQRWQIIHKFVPPSSPKDSSKAELTRAITESWLGWEGPSCAPREVQRLQAQGGSERASEQAREICMQAGCCCCCEKAGWGYLQWREGSRLAACGRKKAAMPGERLLGERARVPEYQSGDTPSPQLITCASLALSRSPPLFPCHIPFVPGEKKYLHVTSESPDAAISTKKGRAGGHGRGEMNNSIKQ